MTPALPIETEKQVELSEMRRGSCPTLARPMQTGDGLLARLRPIGNAMAIDHIRALANAAARFGNGIVEITARGSLQVRGLRPDTVADFEAAVLASGIEVETGTSVETPPLAGIDGTELIDLRPLAARLRSRIAAQVPPLVLAPKLAITLDGGGRFHLGKVSADILVRALSDAGRLRYLLSVGGNAKTARPIALLDESEIEEAVLAVLLHLSAAGSTARGKGLDPLALGSLFDPNLKHGQHAAEAPSLGLHSLHGDKPLAVLGIAFAYCQAAAENLVALADAAEQAGAVEFRLAPQHVLFIPGLEPAAAEALQRRAEILGFVTDPRDPRGAIALCVGARGCASGDYDTHELADLMQVEIPAILDGTLTVHLSGCPKGCAHPAASGLTLVGTPTGYGLVVNGAASAEPVAYIARNDIREALKRLAGLLERTRQAGESVRDCLTRLGADLIGTAVKMENR